MLPGTTGREPAHALTGSYAVDAVDETERTLVERHLMICPDCQDEVATLREAASTLAATSTTCPPASLRRDVLAQTSTHVPHTPSGPRRWVAAAVAVTARVVHPTRRTAR